MVQNGQADSQNQELQSCLQKFLSTPNSKDESINWKAERYNFINLFLNKSRSKKTAKDDKDDQNDEEFEEDP